MRLSHAKNKAGKWAIFFCNA